MLECISEWITRVKSKATPNETSYEFTPKTSVIKNPTFIMTLTVND